jgi:hypothetical protein
LDCAVSIDTCFTGYFGKLRQEEIAFGALMDNGSAAETNVNCCRTAHAIKRGIETFSM